MSDWVKPGTQIACAKEFEVPNPCIPGRPFKIQVGRQAVIVRIGPGDAEAPWDSTIGPNPNGRATTPVSIWDVRPSDIIVGWFDFGTGSRIGFINQLRGDFEHYWHSKSVQAAKTRPQRSMILDRHPDQPGVPSNLKHIGYWASSGDPEADAYFQKGLELPWPEDFIWSNWNEDVRAVVSEHLKNGKPVAQWRGSSACRFGCDLNNGYQDLSDGTYVWPEGFAHYVEAHNVKPPQEFIRHVYATQGVLAGCFGDL